MRIITIGTGGLLVLTAVWSFAHMGLAFVSLAFLLGLAMLIQSLPEIARFFTAEVEYRRSWILAEGVLTFILSILVLSNQLVTDAVVPVFFGMWSLFTGIQRMAAAFDMHERNAAHWVLFMSVGFIAAAAGVYAFLNTILASLPIAMLLGGIFLIQGVSILLTGIFMPRKHMNRHHVTEAK